MNLPKKSEQNRQKVHPKHSSQTDLVIDASTTPDDSLIPVENMLSGYYEMLAGYKASTSLLGKENANEPEFEIQNVIKL